MDETKKGYELYTRPVKLNEQSRVCKYQHSRRTASVKSLIIPATVNIISLNLRPPPPLKHRSVRDHSHPDYQLVNETVSLSLYILPTMTCLDFSCSVGTSPYCLGSAAGLACSTLDPGLRCGIISGYTNKTIKDQSVRIKSLN